MNSRGTRIAQRITGDMLASRDNVAAIPTAQAAVAGTQWNQVVARPRERDSGGTINVIASENKQQNLEIYVRNRRWACSA
ncbi:hypothetical protein MMIN_34420 [Mycolicibacter minnesotensis]|nr:hypothetical protein MMIN_34420 [Mycolicibacter minnesotensis]